MHFPKLFELLKDHEVPMPDNPGFSYASVRILFARLQNRPVTMINKGRQQIFYRASP